jgi:hypothetical protein
MVICENYMFEFSVNKDTKKGYNKESGSREGKTWKMNQIKPAYLKLFIVAQLRFLTRELGALTPWV